MVDVNATNLVSALEELKELATNGVGLPELEEYIKKVITQLKLGTADVTKLSESFSEIKDTILSVKNINWSEELQKWGRDLDIVKQKIYQTVPGIGTLAGEIALLSPQLLSRTEIAKSFDVIGDSADKTSAKLNDVFMSALKLISPEFAKSKTATYLSDLATYADAGKKFELGLVMSAAASGQLSDVIGATGENIDTLSIKSEAFSDLTTKIGNATGYTASQVAQYAKQLMAIPGAMVDVDQPGLIAGERINYLDAAMKVATGTGQTFEQTMEDATFAFENLGLKGQPALEFTARMQNASQALGTPLKFIKQYAEEASNSFALYADDTKAAAEMTQGAINIMGKIGPSLQQSGLGPKAMADVVKGVTDGISRMDTAQKAFLSAQTGGASGLQGAFQIDQMLAEGKIDQVFDKVKKNMSQQLGGNIITRQQAANSPEAAAQFQKQIMFMMSPAMGGMAKDQASAVKLLEAMTSGKTNDKIVDKDKALKDAMERGTKLQERGNSVLTRIANASERMAQLQSITAYEKFRQLGGSENESFQKGLINLRGEAAEASTLDPLKGMGLDGGRRIGEVFSDALKNPMGDLKDALGSSFNFMTSAGGTIYNELKQNVNPVPGSPGIDMNALNIKPATKNLMTPNELASHSLQQQQLSEKIQIQPAKVDVNVTTTCATCQRKIAQEEASKVVNHSHEKNNRQNWISNP